MWASGMPRAFPITNDLKRFTVLKWILHLKFVFFVIKKEVQDH